MTDSNKPAQGAAPARWFTEQETAQRLRMSRKWLQKTRLTGGGPPFAKFGSAVRYSVEDVEAYERRCLRESTSDLGLAD